MTGSEGEKAKEALAEFAVSGRIPCREAFALAERLGVAPRVIGDTANEMGIKISACQLGCF